MKLRLQRARAGRALDQETVERLRPHFPQGFDFARVRIRDRVPRWVAGKPSAVTLGETIYFAPGAYAPETADGLALLAHELAHVAQFRGLGICRFTVRYLAAYAARRLRGHGRHAAYCDIPFERVARDVQAAVVQAQRSTVG